MHPCPNNTLLPQSLMRLFQRSSHFWKHPPKVFRSQTIQHRHVLKILIAVSFHWFFQLCKQPEVQWTQIRAVRVTGEPLKCFYSSKTVAHLATCVSGRIVVVKVPTIYFLNQVSARATSAHDNRFETRGVDLDTLTRSNARLLPILCSEYE